MSRPGSNTPKGAYAATSSVFIASTVNTYIAGIGATASASALSSSAAPSLSSGASAKQKLGSKPLAADTGTTAAADARDAQQRGNVCGNPFCDAKLENAYATFCEQKAHCQLYRGLLLHCASFASEREREIDGVIERLQRTKRQRTRGVFASDSDHASDSEDDNSRDATFSIPKRKMPAVSPMNGAETPGERELRQQFERKQPAVTRVSSSSAVATGIAGPDAPNSKKRRLSGSGTSSGPSAAASSSASSSASSVSTLRTAPSVGGIEVIPLGAGRHPSSFGGGSRYVQSGNRAAAASNLRGLQPLARAPVASKPLETPAATVPPLSPLPTPTPRLQHATSASAARDPRRADLSDSSQRPDSHFDLTPPLPASSPMDAQDPAMAAMPPLAPPPPAKRTMSASDYLTSRKPQDPRMRPPPPANSDPVAQTHAAAHSVPSAASPLPRTMSELSAASTAMAPRERPLSQSLSDPPASAGALSRDHHAYPSEASYNVSARRDESYWSERSARAYAGDRYHDSQQHHYPQQHHSQHRGQHHHGHHRAYEPKYDPHYQSSSSASAFAAPAMGYDHHHIPWHRSSDDAGRPHSRSPSRDHSTSPLMPPVSAAVASRSSTNTVDSSAAASASTPRRSPTVDPNGHPTITPATFSHHDRFLVDVLSRIASFFPHALGAVTNKTAKPRKMRFYLEYVQRVKDLTRARLDVRVADGKAVVILDHRVWLALEGTSTVALYTQVLETLLNQGIAWRKLLEDTQRVYASSVRGLGARGSHADAFLRLWHAFKLNPWTQLPVERHVTYLRGDTRHHWSFCVGSVEIGSGSHEEKREAYRLGAESAMKFLLRLEILNDSLRFRSSPHEQQTSSSASARSASGASSARSRSASTASTTTTSASGRGSASQQPTPPSTRSRDPSPAVAAAATQSSAVSEIVEMPDATVSRTRDDSFGSAVDATFSPIPTPDRSASDDMDMSEEPKPSGSAIAPVTPAAADVPPANAVANCLFCATVRARDPTAKFCMRCKPKQPSASQPRVGLAAMVSSSASSTPSTAAAASSTTV